MFFEGMRISLDNWRQMLRHVQDAVYRSGKALSFGQSFVHGDLQDDASVRQAGYNFRQHVENFPCFDPAERKDELLLRYLFAHPLVLGTFCELCRDGTIFWYQEAMLAWLRKYTRYHLQLMELVELVTCAPSRGADITDLLIADTQDVQRNIHIFDGCGITLRRRVHSMQSFTGIEQCTPEFLDGFTSEAVIQDICVLRDLALYFAAKCFPDDDKVVHCYNTRLFVNVGKAFKTEDLTQGLEELTDAVLNTRFSVTDVRYIGIEGWKRERHPQLLDRQQRETINARGAGHGVSMDDSYARSKNVFSGVREADLPRWMELCIQWHIDLRLVPGKILPFHGLIECIDVLSGV